MNSFDQDDILLEIKRKKSASADVKPAGENAAPAAQTKTAAKSGSQDEEWDLLWQSVSTKQKKPQLFVFCDFVFVFINLFFKLICKRGKHFCFLKPSYNRSCKKDYERRGNNVSYYGND